LPYIRASDIDNLNKLSLKFSRVNERGAFGLAANCESGHRFPPDDGVQ